MGISGNMKFTGAAEENQLHAKKTLTPRANPLPYLHEKLLLRMAWRQKLDCEKRAIPSSGQK